jgi:hypothetical protein
MAKPLTAVPEWWKKCQHVKATRKIPKTYPRRINPKQLHDPRWQIPNQLIKIEDPKLYLCFQNR